MIVVAADLPGVETDADVVLSEPIVFSLPDDLWLRIHPAKTVRRWFVVFTGQLG
ncbi:MAG: hypothetical protein ACP5QG_06795 [candidate division WOR-3 bacterium]